MTTDRQVEYWKNMYESLLSEKIDYNSKFKRVDDVIDALQLQENSPRKFMKIVFKGQFYDIKDIYTIEDDNAADYICIEAEDKK